MSDGNVHHYAEETLRRVIQEELEPIEVRVASLEGSVLSPDVITAIVQNAVTEGLKSHPCWMDEDDRGTLKDLILGGRMFKKAVLRALVYGALATMAAYIVKTRGWFK